MLTAMVFAALLGACGSTAAWKPSTYSRNPAGAPRIVWHDCEGPAQCGTMAVPLAWDDPAGTSITLAVYRRPALDGSRRRGVLLVNPGGPGAPGRDLADHADAIFSSRLRRSFDIVAWDPRGTGASTPVECGRSLDSFFAVDRSPDDERERAAVLRVSRDLAADCARRGGAIVGHVGTGETVRDMDAIRSALRVPTISYLGFSYGTFLGTMYALQFPGRVHRLVLDGPVDPSVDAITSSEQQAIGFEQSLDTFLVDCDRRRSCAFDQGRGARAELARIRSDVEARRLAGRTSGETRRLSPSEFVLGVASALYGGVDGRAVLDDAFDGLRRNDATAMLMLADEYTGRQAGGDYPPDQAAFYAISCADGQGVATAAGLAAAASHAAVAAPFFGADTMWLGAPCAFWSGTVPEAPHRVRAPAGLVTPLVVATTGDPATPLVWGRSLAQQLDAHLLVVAGRAHTAYAGDNTCVVAVVDDYLVDGVLPAGDRRC